MGTCVSVRRDPKSGMGFRMIVGTKATKAAAQNGEGLPSAGLQTRSNQVDAVSSIGSPRFGSKDEFFFDSRGWLDSDCEDDFFSVNGDFTPSRGSTPSYQTDCPIKPHLDKAIFDGFPDNISEPSPRKKLVEFLQETLPGEPAENDSSIMHGDQELNGKAKETNKDGQPPKLVDGTPYLSGINSVCSGEEAPNADFKTGKEKREKAMQCCLPSLVHSLSMSERKKQTSSPGLHSSG